MLNALLQSILSGLAVGSAYALVALGFSLTFTTTKTLNFAHGEFVSAGSFVGVSVLFLMLGLSPASLSFGDLVPVYSHQLLALLVTLAVMAVIGMVLYMTGVRPFTRKPGMAWIMSTLGFGVILHSAGLALWGPKPVVVPSPFGNEVINFAGIGIRPQELAMLTVSIAVMIVFDVILNRTLVGKGMRAVAANPGVAKLMGINVNLMMVSAFMISSALAGLAGFLLAPIAQASLYLGLMVGLKGFSAAMVGGLNNARGVVIGGFIIGVLESTISLWQAQWRDICIFAIVILVLAIKPTGLFGKQMHEKV